MPALPRRFVIWFSLHYSKPESFSDAVLDKCASFPLSQSGMNGDFVKLYAEAENSRIRRA